MSGDKKSQIDSIRRRLKKFEVVDGSAFRALKRRARSVLAPDQSWSAWDAAAEACGVARSVWMTAVCDAAAERILGKKLKDIAKEVHAARSLSELHQRGLSETDGSSIP